MTEDRFLHDLFKRLGPMPAAVVVAPGDDCAALQPDAARLALFAVDQVIGDRHYYASGPHPTAPELVGRKLLARNLSDIAAMGGEPRYAVVAVALGAGADVDWLNRFFDGLLALAREFGVAIVGGDLARAPRDTVTSLTIWGDVEPRCLSRRAGVRDGDVLYVTGSFGDSLASQHHLRFTPRCREGRWLAVNGFTTAMMDVSDGLRLDLARMCRASGVRVHLDTARLPRRTPQTALHAALTDGEDYELMVAVPAAKARELEAAWPFSEVPLTPVGAFAVDPEPRVLDAQGNRLDDGGGFDHFLYEPNARTPEVGRP